jgi:hypothetical protein
MHFTWRMGQGAGFCNWAHVLCWTICSYLRTLLTVVKGATSFESLRTVDSVSHADFREACLARGLLENDNEWKLRFGTSRLLSITWHSRASQGILRITGSPVRRQACSEPNGRSRAAVMQTGHQLRQLFATILKNWPLSDPVALWNRFRENICDDVRHKLINKGSPIPLRSKSMTMDLTCSTQLSTDRPSRFSSNASAGWKLGSAWWKSRTLALTIYTVFNSQSCIAMLSDRCTILMCSTIVDSFTCNS